MGGDALITEKCLGMLALFVLVIGGMYLGIFAPSEAGAAGAFGALVVALMKRQLNKKLFVTALIESAKLECSYCNDPNRGQRCLPFLSRLPAFLRCSGPG